MSNIDFNNISKMYESNSLVQKSAAKTLLSLLNIKSSENVLDVGCGAGNLTASIRSLTEGKVVGVDPSKGMIEKAREKNEDSDIEFYIGNAEALDYNNCFDVIFCNSAFQWFKYPEKSVETFYRVLTKGGRVGIQCPATSKYCPNFITAIQDIEQDPRTRETFKYFKSPWFFLEDADEYAELFNRFGFKVAFSKIDTVTTRYSAEEAFRIFSSGAIAGYLNEDSYSIPLDDNYIRSFKEIIKSNIEAQVNSEGYVDLVFNRIFLVAVKE